MTTEAEGVGPPDITVEIVSRDSRTRDYVLFHSTAMPGFWLDVTWLFQRPLPSRMACLQKILGD